jgi:putative ABC transport system permease protein
MLGIIVGVGAVVVIMSIGAGAQGLLLSQIESIGANAIIVIPGYSEDGNPFDALSNFAVTTLKYEDAEYIRNNDGAPHVTYVAAYSNSFANVKWRSETYDTSITGTTIDYLDVEQAEVETGRFFTKEEEKNLSRVAVLGHAVKEALFQESDAVGQRIKIKDTSFEVIGVMEERGNFGLEDSDDMVIIPIKTAQKEAAVNHLGFMRIRVDSEANSDKSIEDIKMLLREQHNIRDSSGKSDEFTVQSSKNAIGAITAVTDSVRYFLTAMAALSLVVGGIGIMNIMLISVTERTREIGLRKAIGANNMDIMRQFLLESIFVTGIGGLIGIVGGVFLAFLISTGIQFAGFDWQFVIPLSSVFLALIVSSMVGLIFGFYPAWKASKLDPITALQYE